MRTKTRTAWSKARVSLILAAALLLGIENRALAAGTLDDWWLCVENCADEDAGCVDACTDHYNKNHATDPIRTLKLKTKFVPSGRFAPSGATSFGARCPAGSVLSPFDMPIYDDQGLFVIGLESVWVCVPANLEPAG